MFTILRGSLKFSSRQKLIIEVAITFTSIGQRLNIYASQMIESLRRTNVSQAALLESSQKRRGSKVVKVVRKRIIKVKQANIVRASSS